MIGQGMAPDPLSAVLVAFTLTPPRCRFHGEWMALRGVELNPLCAVLVPGVGVGSGSGGRAVEEFQEAAIASHPCRGYSSVG